MKKQIEPNVNENIIFDNLVSKNKIIVYKKEVFLNNESKTAVLLQRDIENLKEVLENENKKIKGLQKEKIKLEEKIDNARNFQENYKPKNKIRKTYSYRSSKDREKEAERKKWFAFLKLIISSMIILGLFLYSFSASKGETQYLNISNNHVNKAIITNVNNVDMLSLAFPMVLIIIFYICLYLLISAFLDLRSLDD